MTGLNELNQRLSGIGMPVSLSTETATRLKQVVPRERVLNAVARIETHNDNGARAFLDKTFQEVGLYPTGNAGPVPAPAPAPDEPRHVVNVQPGPEPDAPPVNGDGSAPRRNRVQHHVYGGKGALTFELDETRSGVPTVALDGALTVAQRSYDWANKVRVQFTTQELPVVAATLLGVLPQCVFKNHGADSDKGFAIEWQGQRSSFFVKVWQGQGNLRAVPMSREDAFYVAQIVICAIQQASPARLDTAGLIATLRAMYARQ